MPRPHAPSAAAAAPRFNSQPLPRTPETAAHLPAMHPPNRPALPVAPALQVPAVATEMRSLSFERLMTNFLRIRTSVRKKSSAPRNFLAFLFSAALCFFLAAPALSAHVEHGTTFNAPGATIYYDV